MNITPIYIEDPGDYYESKANKWDFQESSIPVYWIDKYPYKTHTLTNAKKLASFRPIISKLCYNLENKKDWNNFTNNKEYLDGVSIFLGIHKEYIYDYHDLPDPFFSISKTGKKTSRYLLSEIPGGIKFNGLSKPKMRYEDMSAPSVGKDGQGRALYRDIFLNLNMKSNDLKNLLIHELAHSLCNHIQYRPDDHHEDFQWAEKLITMYWPK